jgi:3-oxoacyl-[acyl-carrier protein] reductase
MFRLDGKIALVSGGSRGIGKACCDLLARQGATVIINFATREDAARRTADAILAAGGRAEALGFDVSDSDAVAVAVDRIVGDHGKVDILVANAGIAIHSLAMRMTDDDLGKLWATNVRGAIACARAAVPSMMRGRWGRIVFISSVVGEMGAVGQSGYAATKAALVGAAKSLARECASSSITTNVVSPGLIDTDMTADFTEEQREDVLRNVPLARAGSPLDVAAACVFLASTEAGYVNGQVLRVNGGMYV